MKSKIKKDKKEFWQEFVKDNKSSKTGVWWRVPLRAGNDEEASPVEVWNWIDSALKEAREEAIKDYTKELKRRIGGIDWLTPVVEKKLLK